MSTAPSNDRQAAEKALWHALEERRADLRAAGLRSTSRQFQQFVKARAAGTLIADLNRAMESRAKATTADPYYLRPMAQAIKHGLNPWEELLSRTDEPWTPYFTPEARRGARRAIEDAKAYIPYL